MVKNAHMRQIEQMESEELMTQKKLRTEVIQLEDMLAQVRKEYEMLRIEFEQNLAANEQTGPINKEMRNLIQSLQTHNVQLKVSDYFFCQIDISPKLLYEMSKFNLSKILVLVMVSFFSVKVMQVNVQLKVSDYFFRQIDGWQN